MGIVCDYDVMLCVSCRGRSSSEPSEDEHYQWWSQLSGVQISAGIR